MNYCCYSPQLHLFNKLKKSLKWNKGDFINFYHKDLLDEKQAYFKDVFIPEKKQHVPK